MDYVQLQNESIKLDELYQRVVAPSCGAVASFIGSYPPEKTQKKIQSPSYFPSCIGITRDNFEGRRVTRLSYEAYESMALKELHRLCDAARQQFNGVEHIAICHRLG